MLASVQNVRAQFSFAQFTGTPTQGCTPLTVNFSVDFQITDQVYVWNFGDGGSYITIGWTASHTYTSSGIFTVQLTVYNGWVWPTLQIVDQFSRPGYIHTVSSTISVSANGAAESCIGAGDGVIIADVSGGTPPFMYSLNGGPLTADSTFTGLSEGWYNIKAYDALGCPDQDNYYIDINLSASITTTPDSCGNINFPTGTAVITATGGTPPYTYSIDGGNTYHSSNIFDSLESKAYDLIVKDSLGCEGHSSFVIANGSTISFTFKTTNAQCDTCASGIIILTATGGIPPFDYLLDDSVSSSDGLFFYVVPGFHTVRVIDATGCSVLETIGVGSYCPDYRGSSIRPTDCNAATGRIIPIVFGGANPATPYTFQWSTGDTTSSISNLPAGDYYLTFTDGNGCMELSEFTVRDTGKLIIELGPDTTLLCSSGGLQIMSGASAGTKPYHYNWSTLDTTPDITVSGSGTYRLTVTDSNGCVETDYISVIYELPGGISMGVLDSMFFECAGDSVQFMAYGGDTYSWHPATGITNLNAVSPMVKVPSLTTNYSVDISVGSGGFGCTQTYSVLLESDDDCVWPGDANHDGTADNYDLLPLGIAYGYQGLVRPNASLQWEAQPSYDWNNTLRNGADYKHIDCSGDAVVDASDTLAIDMNYNFNPNPSVTNGTFTDPPLYFQIPTDSVLVGDTLLDVSVMVGNAAIPVDSLYGIAFSVLYDTTTVVRINILSVDNSILGPDLLTLHKDFPANGKTDISLSKIDHANFSGYGQIATLRVILRNDITANNSILRLDFAGVLAIEHDETVVNLFALSDTIPVYNPVSGINKETIGSDVIVYPNPSDQTLIIDFGKSEIPERVVIRDILGKELLTNHPQQSKVIYLDVSNLSSGIYLLFLEGNNFKTVSKRIALY